MEIKLEIDNGVVILKPVGNLVASTAEELKDQVTRLIEKKYLSVMLDLGKVVFIDSTGLGACIAIMKNLAANNGLLVCTGLNENVRKLFQITRTDQKIRIIDARHDAMDVLQGWISASRM